MPLRAKHPVFRPLGRFAPVAVYSGLRPETRKALEGQMRRFSGFPLAAPSGLPSRDALRLPISCIAIGLCAIAIVCFL
jgi:hypothetical protein